ncbi:MFS transporter [Actinokineospora sp. 24-640]
MSAVGWATPLRVPEFRVILAAHGISLLGGAVAQVALGVLVYTRTGSPLLTALVFAVGLLPSLLAATLVSAVADRFPARRVLIGCQVVSGVVVAGLAVPGLPTAAALLLVFVLGAAGSVFVGVRAAVLPEVLPAEVFALGRGLLRVVANALQVGGYLVGGAALVVLSPQAALLVDAAAFGVAALLLRRTADRPAAVGERGVVRRSLSGAREAWRDRRVRRLLLLLWLPPACAVVPEAVAVVYAAENGIGTAGLGLLLTGTLLGAVLGELALGQWLGDSPRLVGPLLFLVALPLLGFLARPGVLVATLLLVASGAGLGYALGVDRLLLAAAPPPLRSRVLGMATTLPIAAQGAAIAAAGALAELLPAHAVVAVAGAFVLVLAVVVPR